MNQLILSLYFIFGQNTSLLEKFANFEPLNLKELYEGKPENNQYKNKKLDLIAKYIPENAIILEAGSNEGEDTIKLAIKWPKSRILAFEAFPDVFKKLKSHTEHFNNIYPFPYALAKNDGIIPFYLSETQYPASSILDRTQYVEKQFGGANIEIEAYNLDSFCHKLILL